MASNDVTVTSVVTGIHRTKVGSHREIELLLEKDDSIPNIDPNCMIVRFPGLEDIPQRLHNAVTYPKNPDHKRYVDQLVKDVVGRKVGNVPANFCGLFRRLKRDGHVRKIECFSTGERPRPSIQPHTQQKYREQRRMDRRGGGLVLDCHYILKLHATADRASVVGKVRDLIAQNEGDETVK